MKLENPLKNLSAATVALLMMTLLMMIQPAFGQKNRAVVNDVTTLLEILQRDYEAIDDMETRYSALQNDRANVISILKAYTVNFTTTAATDRKRIDNKQLAIKGLKLKLATLNANVDKIAANNLSTAANDLKTANTNLSDSIKGYEALLFNRDILTLEALHNYFGLNNTILHDVADKFLDKFSRINEDRADIYAVSAGAGQVQKSLNLFGDAGMTFTNAIDGLSMFLAKRIKEELATQLFDKIKTQLSEPDPRHDPFLELKILLPKTTELLKTISPEQYPGVVTSIKESIEKDLEDLMDNLPNLATSVRFQDLMRTHPEVEFAFLGVQLINDLNKIKSPTEIIFVLENSALINKWNAIALHADFVNGIRLASLLVYAITEDYLDSRRFVSAEEWDKYYKNEDFYNLFVGFVIQQDKKYYNITFNNRPFATSVTADVAILKRWYTSLAPKIRDILHQAASIEDEIAALKKIKENGGKMPVDSVAHLLRSSITFLDSTLCLSDSVIKKFVPHVDIKVKSRLYFSSARKGVDIYSDIGTKKYYNAIVEAVDLVNDLIQKTQARDHTHLTDLVAKMEADSVLFSALSADIRAGRAISQNTLIALQQLSGDFISSCNCHDFDQVLRIGQGVVSPGSTNYTALTNLNTALQNDPNLVRWYILFFNEKLDTEGLRPLNVFLPSGTLQAQRNHIRDSIRRMSLSPQANADILKVINFVVALAKAQSADDIEAAVEAIVLPAGSALVKREAAWNFSLNAYAGFFAGQERVYNAGANNATANNLAFTVPIGVAISRSFSASCNGPNKNCKPSSSWTLFASIVDVGAFTSVRFSDHDVTLPEITFQNILAPGLQLIWGIPKSSFSIAGGIQYGPMLRKISVSNTTSTTTSTTTQTVTNPDGSTTTTTAVTTSGSAVLDAKSAFRYGISVLIDIPLINFYTKSKGYRK